MEKRPPRRPLGPLAIPTAKSGLIRIGLLSFSFLVLVLLYPMWLFLQSVSGPNARRRFSDPFRQSALADEELTGTEVLTDSVRRTRWTVWLIRALVVALLIGLFPFGLWAPPALAHGNLTVTRSPVTATNTVGTTHTLVATATYSSQHTDLTVTFTFNASGPGAQTNTAVVAKSQAGASSVTAPFSFSSTRTGTSLITVTVSDNHPSGGGDIDPQTVTATKFWHHGPPTTVTVMPDFAVNDVGTSHTITATAVDLYGNPIAFHDATISVFGAGATQAVKNTNASGTVTFTFTSTSPGISDIRVTVTADTSHGSGSSGSKSASAVKIWEVGDSSKIDLEPDSDSNTVGDTHTVTATITDDFGNPTDESGRVVTFTVGGTDGEDPTSATATTDDSGQATFSFTSTKTGTSTINASSPGLDDGTATKTWVIGPITTVTLTQDKDTNEVGQTHTVTATVTDKFGNSPASTQVTFTVTGRGATQSMRTAINGVATFTFVSTLTGTSTITATSNGATSNALVKTWTVGPAATVTVTPSNATNTVGDTHIVTATVTDRFGNLITGTTVTFTVGGTNGESPTSATATTDENGQATFSFTSTRTGTSTITATAGTAFDTATKTWTIGDVTVVLTPGNPTNQVGQSHTVTASVSDVHGNVPDDGTQVTFTVTGAGATEGVRAMTNGVATFTFTSSLPGSSTITATSLGASSEPVFKTWTVGPPATVDLQPENASNPVGTSHTVTATVRDSEGNLLTGTVVTFTTSGTGFETPPTGTATTDDDGQATFSFSSTKTGTSKITATAGSASDTATKTWTIGDVTVVLTQGNPTNQVGQAHTVTASVSDVHGNVPDDGTQVTFTVAGRGATQSVKVMTDGVATFSFTSSLPGSSTITATSLNDTSDPVFKTWVVGPPANVDLQPENASNPVGTTHTVTAEVTDSEGNLLTGTVVTFTASGTGFETPPTGTATTDDDGQATFSFFSTKTGTSNITATAGTAFDTATKTWTSGPVDSIVLTPPTSTNQVTDPHTLTATVLDEHGNDVADDTAVTFTVDGVGATEGVRETTDGIATFTFTSTQSGNSTITATSGGETSDEVFKEWIPGGPAKVDLRPLTGRNVVGESHTMTATVTDSEGNPVADGTVVTFTVDGPQGVGNTSQTATRLTVNGVATFTFISTTTGLSKIVAESGGAPASNDAHKNWDPGPPASVTLTQGSPTNVAGTPHTVSATVKDQFGNPVSETAVTFTVTGVGATEGVRDTDDGVAVFTFTSTQAGQSVITAAVGTTLTSNAVTKTWVAGAPQTVTVEPATDENTVGETHTVTATVFDQHNNPVSGTTVTFSVTGTGEESPASGTAITDGAGKATFAFTSTNPGTSDISATAGTATGTAEKHWRPGPPATVVLTQDSSTNTVGDTHTVTATVKDQYGNFVTDTTQVTFTVAGEAATEAVRETTDGIATFTFVSTQAGVSTITATSGNAPTSNELIKTWEPGRPPFHVVLDPKDATNFVGETHTVTATVLDDFDNPTPGRPVTFTVTGTGEETPTSATATTDGSGQATFSFTSSVTGTSNITATSEDASPDTATKTWVPKPGSVTIDPPTATNEVGEIHTVTATVRDSGDEPIPNEVVTFTVSGTGEESPDFATATTDGSGQATFSFSSTKTGTSHITASAGEVSGTATKDWTAGPANTVTLTQTSNTNQAGDPHTVTATVKDIHGNNVEDDTDVTFTVTGVGATEGVRDTTDGIATFTFTSTETGTSTITATADGKVSNALIKNWTPGPAASVVLTQGPNVNQVEEMHDLTATVRDTHGNLVEDDTDVTFTVTGVGATEGVRDTTNGIANFSFTSTETGVSTITATADGAPTSNLVTKTWTAGPAASVVLTQGPNVNQVEEMHDLTATVRDEHGNLVEDNTEVTFTVTGRGATQSVQLTDDGIANFSFTSTETGVSTITATAEGAPTSNLVTKTWTAGPAETVVLSQDATSNQVDDPHTVTALVKDIHGNNVEDGTDVTFTVTGVGATEGVRDTTDGIATFTFISTETGTSTITATADGKVSNALIKNWTPGPAASVVLTQGPNVNQVEEMHDLTATVRDTHGNLVEDDTEVTFTVTGRGATQSVQLTDDGIANFSFTSTETGVSTITATADGAPTSNLVTKTWTAGPAASVVLTQGPNVNQVEEMHDLTATVRDEHGNLVEDNTEVTFTVTGRGATQSVQLTDDGIANFSFTSTETGVSTITATAEGAPTSNLVTKTWTAGPAENILLTQGPSTNPVGEPHTVTATVTDENENLVEDDTDVTFTVTGVGATEGVRDTTDGIATFTFTSTQTGVSTITAAAAGVTSDHVTKTWTPGPAASVVLTQGPNVNEVEEMHDLTATVRDTHGNLVEDNTEVTFTVTGRGATESMQLTDDGIATFSFTSTQTGVSTITATAEGAPTSNVVTKTWTAGPAENIVLTQGPSTNPVGEPHTVTATVTDENENSVEDGTDVTFTVTGVGATEGVRNTDDGVATFTFTSEDTGVSTITAAAAGVTSDHVTKTWVAGPPETIDLTQGPTVNQVGEPHTVTATVTDEFDHPVADGTPVTFTVTGAGATESVRNTTNGVSTFTFTSTQAGTSTITARAGTATSNSVTKTWTAGPPGNVVLSQDEDTNLVGTPHRVTAAVTDQHGNAVANGTEVTFTVIGVGATQGVRDTTNGFSTFTFTSNSPGTSTITATSGGAPSNVLVKNWVINEAQDVTLTQGSPTNVVGQPHTVTATVTDQFGGPMPDGSNVTFTVAGAGATESVRNTQGGVATFTFTSTETGISTITARSGDATSNSVTKTWIAGAPFNVTLTQGSSTNTVGDPHTVTASVEDQYGNDVADGTPVTFTVAGAGATESVRNTQGGVATFTFTSTQAGTSTITARSGDATSNVLIKTWIADSSSNIDLTQGPSTNQVGQPHTVTATVTDQHGNAVADDTEVSFTVTGVGATQGVRDTVNGIATFTFTSTQTDTSNITARSGGATSNSVTKTWTAGPPSDIELTQGTATNTVGDPHTVTATVQDQFGNAVANGTDVTFTVTGVGATEGVRDTVNGVATFTFTSNQAGRSTITARSGNATSNQVTKTWVAEDGEPEEPLTQDWWFGGGILIGGPDASSWAPGRLDVFVRGTDNSLWHKHWNGTQWSGWEDLGGILTSDPTAVSWGPDRIDIFVRGADNAMWHMYWQNAWSAWESLGGNLTSGPDASSWQAGRLDIFVRGGDNGLWHMYWNGSAWSGWEGLGGVLTADPGAVSWSANRIDIFVRGADNGMWHLLWNGGAWVGWENLGGTLDGGPDPASWGPNRLDIFVQGADDALWQMTWNGSSWVGWTWHGGILTSSPGAVSWGVNRIDTFARGTDNALWHKFYDPSDGLGGWHHEHLGEEF